MNNPYTLRTFTIKRTNAGYDDYIYTKKQYISPGKAMQALRAWLDKNYPSATITKTRFQKIGIEYKLTVTFEVLKLESVLGRNRIVPYSHTLTITWIGKKAYEKITTL